MDHEDDLMFDSAFGPVEDRDYERRMADIRRRLDRLEAAQRDERLEHDRRED